MVMTEIVSGGVRGPVGRGIAIYFLEEAKEVDGTLVVVVPDTHTCLNRNLY